MNKIWWMFNKSWRPQSRKVMQSSWFFNQLTLVWSKPSVLVATTNSWVRTEVTCPGKIPSSFFLTFAILRILRMTLLLYFELWVGNDAMEYSRTSVKCWYWMQCRLHGLLWWCLLWQESVCTERNIFKQAGFLLSQVDVSFNQIQYIYEYHYIYH